MTRFGSLCVSAQVVVLGGAEGRTDGRSQRTILEHVAPRHLIIVRGTLQVFPLC